ncbi:uncharacterized protein LOC121962425 [Plectropomus leopardus]|uniref:uncharacterized protein LOC121962425 n=1 Tax=Plectropomus leopardus TaxID=160734 RepID=UPI001C4C3EFB|nr:uncharacterized protein LOC121962425 [Plectropomus leopardus]
MAFGFCISVTLLLSVWATAKCDQIPDEVLHMECRDRYFMIAVDLSFTGNSPHFEAVDGTGVYAITKEYAAQCGYTVSVLPLAGHVELRASYFSCHADNKDDEVFTFNFNLVTTNEGNEVTYALKKTCSPSLPWSPREVTCEANYMEVSVRSDVACPSGTKKDDWDAVVQTAYTSAASDWQVMFQRMDQELTPMSLTDAQEQGYAFDLTDGRLVFRAPYGQPDSFSTEVNGVPVEVVHATLFSRQNWVVLMVDLEAACSKHEGSYDDSGYMTWETPDELYPSLGDVQLNLGLNGELVEQPVAEERGFIVEKHNTTVQINIPYNADGGYRKSLVSDGLHEFYIFHLYLEQISVDEDHVDTRLRFHRTLATPLLPRPVFTENIPLMTTRAATPSQKVVHPNTLMATPLQSAFDDPIIEEQFSKAECSVLQYKLVINVTLTLQTGPPALLNYLWREIHYRTQDPLTSDAGGPARLYHVQRHLRQSLAARRAALHHGYEYTR